MKQPDTITIEVTKSDEIFADHVDLMVTVKGKSIFTGQEAFKKAEEVRQLVDGLTGAGLPEEDILLVGVQADVSTGLISKGSAATYRLRIKCWELDTLADLLGVITAQDNTHLTQMVWGYTAMEDFQTSLLGVCLSKAKRKAGVVASSLGVELLGVHEFNEGVVDSEAYPRPQPVAAAERSAFKSRTITPETLGLSVSHAKRVTLKLSVKYRVGPLKE